jgi:hypothetical protein
LRIALAKNADHRGRRFCFCFRKSYQRAIFGSVEEQVNNQQHHRRDTQNPRKEILTHDRAPFFYVIAFSECRE